MFFDPGPSGPISSPGSSMSASTLFKCRHVRQVKRHMINRFRRRFTFEQRNCHVVVAHRDSIVEIEFFAQPQRALEPLRALLRITHSQTEVTNLSEHEWNLHEGIESLSFGLRWFGAVSRNERLHEMPVEICQGVARRFPQSAGAPPHFWTDKCQPDVADHSHSWAQTCSRAARMIFEIVLDILFDHRRQLFNCKRDHIPETCANCHLDVKAASQCDSLNR